MTHWLIAGVLFAIWFAYKVVLGRGAYVNLLLLCAIAIAVVQLTAQRRASAK